MQRQRELELKLFSTDQDRMIQRWQVYWSYTVLHVFWLFGFTIFKYLLQLDGQDHGCRCESSNKPKQKAILIIFIINKANEVPQLADTARTHLEFFF